VHEYLNQFIYHTCGVTKSGGYVLHFILKMKCVVGKGDANSSLILEWKFNFCIESNNL